MKKKNLKTLKLKKASISKLSGGAQEPIPVPLTINIRDCYFTWDIRQCTWYSELYTACECEPSWDLGCQESINSPCPL